MTTDGPLGLDVDYPRLLLYALVVVVLIGLIVAASTSSTAFGAYNDRWDGASELRATATGAGSEPTVVRNISQYDSVPPSSSVALVLSPDRGYDDADRARLDLFVSNGGTLVVAEDVGPHGNTLLESVGATARFDGSLLRDEQRNHRASTIPVTPNVSNHSLTSDVTQLTLNRGTVVDPGEATVLVQSSEFSYLDLDANGEINGNESLERRPVATVERVDDGRVVAVSDPSLFINAMLDRPDNRQFARNLFGSGRYALLDYSHTADIPPLTLAVLVVRETVWLQTVVGMAALAVISVWSRGAAAGLVRRLRRRVRRERTERESAGATTEDLVAYVRSQHPDWDEERVRRVVASSRADSGVSADSTDE